MIVARETASHWYDRNGVPCHHVPYADKKKAGQMRPTMLTDARKLGLLPSVTNIVKGGLPNENLTAWRIEQAIMAALTLPRMEGEELDVFARRVVEDSERTASDAAAIGTAIHLAIEEYLTAGTPPHDEQVAKYWPLIRAWLDANIEKVGFAEQRIVGNGYAGTVDLYCVPKGPLMDACGGSVLIDFKTRNPYKGKFSWYPTDIAQLEAYNREVKAVKVASVFIARDTPQAPHFHVYSDEERAWGNQIFDCAFSTWKALKKYDPTNA